ncbi:BTB/POZ domain-containing protein [Aspergillus clavatus NRRL 1]|uniref:Uncharacterized protein n=1 Tax=Aspergillus clavatus (strain ATCC 1007 / CBS 513.65 / DSM 816 / NCTC 3887 / NRRL 1 / QM 1276 / 107) TaxID=344612 RepID=A1CEE5_ASPCL|nr:uncharacterized protein ACLA_089360 [Aspergillus clavatus NRRL 1]EAW11244.1 hypothetical protein ACLA_089360 [Aspergillus clavatus NRRL 1]
MEETGESASGRAIGQNMHIIDPDGEVVIILRNANAPFAEWSDDLNAEPNDPGPAQQPNCDNDTENSHRFQVSMKHLTLASPVFKKILTGGWKESATYLQKGTVEITAESWDSEALLILLRAMHCQNDQLPKQLTLEMIAKLAILADYYECREVLGFFSNIWVQALEKPPATLCRDSILWLWISWFFRLPEQFEEVTSTVMSQSNGCIDHLGLPIPATLIETMYSTRESWIDTIIKRLRQAQADLFSGKLGCGLECRSIMYGALTLQMHPTGLLSPSLIAPYLGANYHQIVQHISALASPEWGSTSKSARGNLRRHSCSASSFVWLLGYPSGSIPGISGEDKYW